MQNKNAVNEDVKVVLKWIVASWMIVFVMGIVLGAGLYAITLASCGG